MSERGVIAVDRGIFADPTFANEPFTEREAFVWMVAEAAWKDRTVRTSKGPLKIYRSELCHSVRFMAEAWNWSKSRVSRFVQRLQKSGTVLVENRDGVQVYKIKNYNKFQRVSLPERDKDGTAAGQERDSSGTAAGQTRRQGNIKGIEDIEEGSAQARPIPPVEEAFSIFCKAVSPTPIPIPKTLTKDRKAKLAARLSEHGIAAWETACRKLAASRFCRGQNDRGWVAGFDFLLQPSSFNKLIEGQYDNREPVKPEREKSAVDILNDYVKGNLSDGQADHHGDQQPLSALRGDVEGRDPRDDRSEDRNSVVISGYFGRAGGC